MLFQLSDRHEVGDSSRGTDSLGETKEREKTLKIEMQGGVISNQCICLCVPCHAHATKLVHTSTYPAAGCSAWE